MLLISPDFLLIASTFREVISQNATSPVVLYQRSRLLTHFWDSQISETLTRCLFLKRSSINGWSSSDHTGFDGVKLRAAAEREKDGSAARRMLALAMVLDGADRKSATKNITLVDLPPYAPELNPLENVWE